jgi:hypothetical protein
LVEPIENLALVSTELLAKENRPTIPPHLLARLLQGQNLVNSHQVAVVSYRGHE